MRIKIVDSHRYMKRKIKDELALFFSEVKSLSLDEAYNQVDLCVEYFEKEYAVKWFEVMAYENGEIAGYLRCFRNPDTNKEWFIGDVHVRKAHRQKGVATKLYEKAIDTVMEYEAAERIITSVHCDNIASIRLHKKLGFKDTKKPCKFPNLYFDSKETEYKKMLYKYLLVPDIETGMKELLPFWKKEDKSKNAEANLHQALYESISCGKNNFYAVWCGNRLIGFDILE